MRPMRDHAHSDYCLIHHEASEDISELLRIADMVVNVHRDEQLTHASCMAIACLLIANSIGQEMIQEGSVSLETASDMLRQAMPHLLETILCGCVAVIESRHESS